MYLRQSTAGQEILLGPFLDSTDGNAPETALTIANTDIKLHKHGAITEANKASGGATHIAGGRYYSVLDATDTDTLGNLEVNVHVAGALAVRRQYTVLTAQAFDSLILGTDLLQVDTTQITGTAQTARDVGASVLLSSGTGTGQISLAAGLVDIIQAAADKAWTTTTRILTANTNFNDPLLADIADAVWDEGIADHLGAGSTGASLNAAGSAGDPWTTLLPGAYGAGTAGLLIGNGLTVTNATIDTKVDGIKAKTDTIPVSPAAVGDIPTAVQVRTEVDTNSTQLAAIKAKTDTIPVSPAAVGDIPTAIQIRTEVDTNSTQLIAIKAKTDTIPVSPAAVGDIPTAVQVRTEVDTNSTQLIAIKAKTDTIPVSPAAVGDIPTAIQVRTEVDTNSTQLTAIVGRLPAALSSGRMVAAVEALGGSTLAVTHLRDHSLRAVPVTFTGGTTTTAILGNVDGAAASTVDDVYNGRVLIFSAPTGLKDQACEITDYVGGTATATISAVTIAVGATAVAILV